MNRERAGWLVVTSMLSLVGLPAMAGVRFETKAGAEQNVYRMEGAKFRVEQKGADGARTILVDNAQRTLTLLNDVQKSYQTMKLDQLEQMGQQDDKRLEEALAALPPDQREAVRASSKGKSGKAGEIKFVALNKKDKVAGYSCDWYRGTRDSMPFVEGCFIPWAATGISSKEVEPLFKTIEALQALSARLGRGGEPTPGADKAPGFPAIRIPLAPSGTKGTEERLVSLKKEAVPAADLAVPKGYEASAAPPAP